MKKALYIIVIMILIIAFCVSAFLVARYVLEGKKQADRYEDLANIKNQAQTSVPTQAAKPSVTTEPSKPGFEVISDPTVEGGILLDYAELHEMNPDMAGWIKIEGTKVDYPVMQTSTNNKDFYLKRDFDKQDSVRGSIYAREECDLDKPSDNITIYGHNMADGSMFHSLMSYTEKSAWDYNSLIFFDTLKERHIYKIFSVFKTSANAGKGFSYHQFVDAQNETEFNDFVTNCKNLSFYDTGITPKYGDKIICLSTCEYTLNNGRLVVAAVRIS
jgi:sortase B